MKINFSKKIKTFLILIFTILALTFSLKKYINNNIIFESENILLLKENNSLYLGNRNTKQKILIEKNIKYDILPKIEFLKNTLDYQYFLISYGNIHCGGAGTNISFYVVQNSKSNNNMHICFDHKNIPIKYTYKDNKIITSIKSNNLKEYKVIYPISKFDNIKFKKYTKQIKITNNPFKLKINDKQQLIVGFYLVDSYTSIDIGCLYLTFDISNKDMQLIKAFKSDLNHFS
ncbi:MAG: hypothetical protein N4A54_12230 [Peptostreptococcaceae bacterium]|jgi:hypothetical protein|nr:hypothetical protein [Peptostreptococcaceae bacterium]